MTDKLGFLPETVRGRVRCNCSGATSAWAQAGERRNAPFPFAKICCSLSKNFHLLAILTIGHCCVREHAISEAVRRADKPRK